jgi:hypothetical protein
VIVTVSRRSKVPEAIFIVVNDKQTYLYHSYQHAWNRKESAGGKLFKISTARMEEIIT